MLIRLFTAISLSSILALKLAKTLAAPPVARCPELWDGRAGGRIAEVLLAEQTALRPTAQATTNP